MTNKRLNGQFFTTNSNIKLESGTTKNPLVETLRFIAKTLGTTVDNLLR